MSYHLPDVVLSAEWQDLVTLYPEISNVKITIQAKFVETCYVFAGSKFVGNEELDSPTPAENDGALLLSGKTITGTATKWFVKGKGKVSIFVE